eukprot:TRINITY_DN20709_c0_g1_i2.p1 TRINITY_DN20709_c0_g1~~TRINITY_DN20709_c0_g1_i2.p1  ORF type:complete len:426 (+),score=87.19 TRINITY_DN20709_c0_g1_i2:65-1342(+)
MLASQLCRQQAALLRRVAWARACPVVRRGIPEGPPAVSSRAAVTVTIDRLQDFLDAEIRVMAKSGDSNISIEQILALPSLQQTAVAIHKELPVRFAKRLAQIENTSEDWQEIVPLVRLREVYRKSFTNLRLVELEHGCENSIEEFTAVIMDLRKRHTKVMHLLSQVAQELRKRGVLDDAGINNWLHQFMHSRIGTEMLTRHYEGLYSYSPQRNRVGIVDTRCNPAQVVREAVEHVQKHLAEARGVPINLAVAQEDIEFPFISTYLFWIVVELLKNSVQAVWRERQTDGATDEEKDVHVTVCADSGRIGLRISDKGGGIPFDVSHRIWEFMFTSKPQITLSHPGDLASVTEEASVASGPLSGALAGPGMGLPNCKLYVQYLGGTIDLMSMPSVGTDVYIFFERIDAQALGLNQTQEGDGSPSSSSA